MEGLLTLITEMTEGGAAAAKSAVFERDNNTQREGSGAMSTSVLELSKRISECLAEVCCFDFRS